MYSSIYVQYLGTSSRDLPAPAADFGCNSKMPFNKLNVSFWANVMLAFSCKLNISGVSLIGSLFMYTIKVCKVKEVQKIEEIWDEKRVRRGSEKRKREREVGNWREEGVGREE